MILNDEIANKKNIRMNEESQSLEDYVKGKGSLELEEIYSITLKLCEAFEDMNTSSNFKRNLQLKPSNIILIKDQKTTLRIKNILETDIDFFSIGMIMYFMAMGRMPFTFLEPILDENSDYDLKRVISKCFEYDAKSQYISINELIKDISIIALRESVHKERRKLYAINTEETNNILCSKRVKKSNRWKEKLNLIGIPVTIDAVLRLLQYAIKKSKSKLILR